MIQGLLKQSGKFFSGLVFTRIVTTITFILLARTFSPEVFGDMTLYLTLIVIATYCADFGLVQWYQKTIDPSQRTRHFQRIVGVRIYTTILTLILFAVIFSYVPLFTPTLHMLFMLNLIPEAFLSILTGYYIEKKEPLKVSFIPLGRAFGVLLVFALWGSGLSAEMAIIGFMLGSCGALLLFFPWQELKGFSLLRIQTAYTTLRESLPYAYLILTSLAYARADQLIIRFNLTAQALGYYGAAYKYLEAASLIPSALAQNLFPISSKKDGVSLGQLTRIMIIMLSLGAVVSGVVHILSDFLILDLMGEAYRPAIYLLHILSVVIFLFFANAPLSTVVQSSDLVKKFLPWGVFNTSLNVGLNFALIPMYGVAGAAYAMLLTEITGLLINLYFTKKVYAHSN